VIVMADDNEEPLLRQSDLDRIQVNSEDGEEASVGVYLNSHCHSDRALFAKYTSGVLVLECEVCRKTVARILVQR